MSHDVKTGEHNGSKAEQRIFHYTVAENYNKIVRDRLIRPAAANVPPGERPAVWFSVHPVWEPTATKALRDRETGKVHRATWEEMQAYGSVRIEVGPGTAPHRWKDYLRLSGASPATARGLERAARGWGATPLHWRVPIGKWRAAELWSGAAWEPIRESERARPQILLKDPGFAFIAKTEEEWAALRQADIVVARDAKTGELSVVFGRERVQRARDDGDEKVRALV